MVFHETRSGRNFNFDLLNFILKKKNDKVRRMLEEYQPSDPSLSITRLRNSSEDTLLHEAAQYGNEEIVKLLIDLGSDVDAQNCFGHTPLILAADHYQRPAIKVLLEAKADVLLADCDGDNALDAIVGYNLDSSDMLEKLVVYGFMCNEKKGMPSDFFLEKLRSAGITLSFFVRAYSAKYVKVLLDHGYAVNGKDEFPSYAASTALHEAVKAGNLEVIKLLLDYGADVNGLDSNKATPLYYLFTGKKCDGCCLNILKILIISATSLTTICSWGEMQVRNILVNGCAEAVKMVLQQIDNLDVYDREGHSLLHYVARNDNVGVIEAFRDRNFNVNTPTEDGLTPLFYAVDANLPDNVQFFLEHGANVHARCDKGTLPLHSVFYYFESFDSSLEAAKKCVQILLEYGADPFDYHKHFYRNIDTENDLILWGPILAYLAIGKVRGIEIPDSHLSQIVLQPLWIKYLDECEKELERMRKSIIYGKVTLFDFLTENEKIFAYARNEELVCKLEKHIRRFKKSSPYRDLLRRRLEKATKSVEIKAKAVASVFQLINVKNNAHLSTAEYVVDYLSVRDMETLNFVK